MNLKDLRFKLLNPDKGPVDVEFEYILLRLLEIVGEIASSSAAASELQRQFCQQVRTGKMVFENKVATFYGLRYRGDTGGEILISLVEAGLSVIEKSSQPDPKVMRSVRSHLTDIQDVHRALPREATQRPFSLVSTSKD